MRIMTNVSGIRCLSKSIISSCIEVGEIACLSVPIQYRLLYSLTVNFKMTGRL